MKPRDKDTGRWGNADGTPLPPRKPTPQNPDGRFISRTGLRKSDAYSKAIRELFETKEKGMPTGWDPQQLTEAQALAMRHLAMAKAGHPLIGTMIVDRAEGKVAIAAEDREALAAGSGLRLLAEVLGLRPAGETVVTVHQVEEPALLSEPDVEVETVPESHL